MTELHTVLQNLMGWEDYHLHHFETSKARYGEYRLAEEEPDLVDYGGMKISKLFPNVRSRAHYFYDYGDSWHLVIQLEKRIPIEEVKHLQSICDGGLCIAGENESPKEDTGGIYWHNDNYRTPTGFDIDSTNQRLKR
jgi:hypothetical protein